MALTKYAYWDFSDGGLTPKITNQVDSGFGLVKVGTLTEKTGEGFTDAGGGFLRTGFATGQGPFCNDDVFCARLLFDTTQFQNRNIFCNGISAIWAPLSIQLATNGSLFLYNNSKYTTAKYKADGTLNDLRIVVDRIAQTVKITINGDSETISYNAYKDPTYPNISFGDVIYGSGTHTPFIGNMYKAWYSDAEEGLEIEPKILFKKDSNFYKFNSTTNVMDLIGSSVTDSDFVSNGISSISYKTVNKTVFEGYKPMIYNAINSKLNFKMFYKPKKVLIKGSGDILLNAKQIKKLKSFTTNVTKNGSGVAKIVFSIDSGITWKKYNSVSGLLENVNIDVDSVLASGNTSDEINSIPESIWVEATNAQKIRFAYALNKVLYSDIIKVNRLSMKADIWGYLTEYKGAEVRLRNGYSEIIIPEIGTYVVTYL